MSTINKSSKRFIPKVRERKGNQVLQNRSTVLKAPVLESNSQSKSGDDLTKNLEVNTISKSIKVKTNMVPPVIRRASASLTGQGIEFVQPNVAPRKRLNSLSTPSIPRSTQGDSQLQSQLSSQTQITLPPAISRRGSIALGSANASRRGSIIEGRLEGLGNGGSNNNSGPVSIGIPVQRNKRRRTSRLEGVITTNVSNPISTAAATSATTTTADAATTAAPTTDTDSNTRGNDFEKSLTKEPKLISEIIITPTEEKLGKKTLFNKTTKQYEIVNIQGRTIEELSRVYESRPVRSLQELATLKQLDLDEDLRSISDSLVLDTTSISMRDLCKPSFPVGTVSENYELAREGEKKLEAGRIYRRRVRETARQLRVSEAEAAKIIAKEDGEVEVGGGEGGGNGSVSGGDVEESGVKKEKSTTSAANLAISNAIVSANTIASAPVLELSQGKLTYAVHSTVIDRHGRDSNNTKMERVEENPFEGIVTSATYSPRPVTTRWTPQEVSELLRAVAAFGTDFGLIAELFPHRTRRQVKARFLLEEKVRPHLVEIALARRDVSLQVEEYAGLSGRSENGGVPSLESFHADMEALRERHAEEARALEASRAAALREDAGASRGKGVSGSGSGSGTTGRGGNRRAVVLAEFRKNEEVVGLIK
ncbi:hypothetical protein CANINC_003706 [Pichia inconspicua]|uniref:SANT domain-containing protein n=1 Tax=Pichia inconspicua TaxID=52247 RepID=A0A4T0WY23_9ASCO|nr:hypothetical protein CANINC_003706 [[Candida] inconspicua]